MPALLGKPLVIYSVWYIPPPWEQRPPLIFNDSYETTNRAYRRHLRLPQPKMATVELVSLTTAILEPRSKPNIRRLNSHLSGKIKSDALIIGQLVCFRRATPATAHAIPRAWEARCNQILCYRSTITPPLS